MENRTDRGTFAPKSDSERKVRSIRATDHTWDDFGFEADKRRITRADLLEQWVKGEGLVNAQVPTPIRALEAVAVLEQALTLKANAGGAIKAEIRRALDLLT
jgi:hypothetical protein